MNDNSSHSQITSGNRLRFALLPLLTALALAIGSTGCSGGGDDGAGDGIHVVATTSILGDVARNVVGDAGSVDVLIPIGADPHSYQASSRQAAALVEADLVVANGLGLEEGLTDVLAAAAGDGARILELGPMLDPLPFADDEADHDDEGDHDDETDHEHGSLDPHVWLDPIRMATATSLIAGELEDIAPDGGWGERAEGYAADLVAASADIESILSAIPEGNRNLVTNHQAFGYFADRYGFAMVGTVIPGGSTMAEPSSAELAALADEIRTYGVAAVFVEVGGSQDIAETLSEETGIAVVELYTGSLGEAGSGADTLISMLRTNALRIAEALS